MTDIEIAQNCEMLPVSEIAKKISLNEDDYELYGKYKAKISFKKLNELQTKFINKQTCKLILVTAMTPPAAGEGKSTVTISLTDGLKKSESHQLQH